MAKAFRKSNAAALVIATIISSQASAAETTATDTMVVTASGFQQRIQDSAASISVVTREQIENKAYTDITDALKDVPVWLLPAAEVTVILVFVVCRRNTP
ncbi:putative outer membrane receptor [Yersinia enterocolitica]|nr:putative outer membrane receptor [Yersinia enterocolitica]